MKPRPRARKIALCIFVTMAAAIPLLAQAPASNPAFDVVSVKPNRSGENPSSISRSDGRITFDNVSLRELISFANRISDGRDYELVGPAWLDSEKFNVAATFPPETSRDLIRQMSQGFLVERFGLKTHRENKSINAYALVVDKRGPKLTSSSTADGVFTFREGHITARGFSMSSFADRLSGPVFKLDRPVIDMTAIKGIYDFELEWAPDNTSSGHSGASIFTAIQEQLGLRLETRTTSVSILVVDRVNRIPSSN
jgi:uncharacterized protein (TIGR03435 family)